MGPLPIPETNFARFILLYIACVVALALKHSSYRIAAFPILCAIYGSMIVQPPTHRFPTNMEYQFGLSGAVYLLQATSHLLLNDSINLRRKGQEKSAMELSFLSRLGWSTNLLNNNRGVNWTCEVRGLRHSSLPRWAFVRLQILWAVLFYLCTDLLSILSRENPAFRSGGGDSMGAQGVARRIWNANSMWLSVYCFMQFHHTMGSIIAVSLGLSDPDDWPAWFGPLEQTVSVRKFWGQTWHQGLRFGLSSHGQYLANTVLGFPKGSQRSSYTQLYTAFLMSGVLHGAADFVVTHQVPSFKSNVAYYTLQAVVITFEDAIVALAKTANVRQTPKALAYLWVICWLGWTSPIWFKTLVTGGMGDFAPPVSLISKFWLQ